MFIFTKINFLNILKYFYLLLVSILILSCDPKQEKENREDRPKPLLSIVHEYSSVKKVKPNFKQDIEGWKELRTIENFLGRFKKGSSYEILSNAEELKSLAKNLKDSIKPTLFNKKPSFDARVNIFYNETLRLADMTSIPAIKAEEVNKQTEKTLDAFSAINAKINTILSKKRFEEAIDVDVTFIGLDSTKMDSVSRRSVDENIRNRFEENGLKNDVKKKSLPKLDKNLKKKRQ
ncbi:hypothetical protein BW723_05270 [Polaribacter reichenbachii]|uniref:Lipoprotein n=1 Tax=Polaribacter reichenbachii TaxID=996801 RepID=A0A1B8TU62_9FLAO|nr:hypothetical protein BW723_05270 [Polaribacter reichenbachii]AUC19606.1 hypothetical protein BTO17_13285 [Polaribacter reichenbachii]OBY63241.1 hypothetical protein LPB301_10440 [Polaribacter reichenbachii]